MCMAAKPTVATTSYFSLMGAALTLFFEGMALRDHSTDSKTIIMEVKLKFVTQKTANLAI